MELATFPHSGAVRVQSFHIIKFGYPMRRAGYSAAVFSARVPIPEAPQQHEAYYAYAYWPHKDDRGSEMPEYICLSSTFDSRDGEYRHRFIWYRQFLEGYEKLVSLMAPLERMLMEAIGDGELELDLYFFASSENQSAAADYSNSSRLGIKALAAVLAIDALRAYDGTLQNHASREYAATMSVLYRRCRGCFSSWDVGTRKRLAVFSTGEINQPNRAQCGQKLIPLTIREALQVNDINFAPWREIWISQRATDLIVNGIAPMFPIFNNWTYLAGVDRQLFENKAMHERYDRSAQAEAVSESLRQARSAIEASAGSDYRMGQLDAHVWKSLEYAQDFVLLTDLAMCTTGEYVGITVRSLPEIVLRSNNVDSIYLRVYEHPALQARYLFDLCYGAHALHTRVGAVHADLHLNNMTIREIIPLSGESLARAPNHSIAYISGPRGEADTYVFPHDGLFACLIDFSRAIIGPAARPQMSAEFGEAFAAGFYRDQVSRALRVLHHYIPSFVLKHQEKIRGLLLAEPDAMFSVLTAVDFLAIGRNYGALLRELAAGAPQPGYKRQLKVAPEGIALAARVEQIALEHLIAGLSDLIGDEPRRREVADAGEAVLPGAFDEYRYSAWASADDSGSDAGPRPYPLREATLVDVYNAAAPLEYSSSDYSRFPPWAKFETLERHLGGLKIAAVTADRGERPFLRSLGLDSYLAVLQEQVRRRAEDAPADATSSWIAE